MHKLSAVYFEGIVQRYRRQSLYPSGLWIYATRSFFVARSFNSSRSKGSALTWIWATSLVALDGVESRMRKASLTAEVSTATRRLVAAVPVGPDETGLGASGDRSGAAPTPTPTPTPIDVARAGSGDVMLGGNGFGDAVAVGGTVALASVGVAGAGVSSIVGPVHFVRPATTSASNASEANLALG